MGSDTLTEESGETAKVIVTRTVQHSLDSVWGALMAPHGASALLGEGGELGTKGSSWHAIDGTHGVTRSFHPMEQIRFSWHADEDAPATIVDLHLKSAGDATDLELVHDHLPADADREGLTEHWTKALERIDAESA